MRFLEEIEKISKEMLVKKIYIDGDINQFINELNDNGMSKELIDLLLDNETEFKKNYISKIADINRKLELICELLTTKKLEKNRTDLIKVGTEMLKISQEIIELGGKKYNE